MEEQELSRALIAYLGRGRSAFPMSDADAAAEVAADAHADPEALLAGVLAVVAECMAIEIDWSNATLSEAGDEAEQVMATRHPELSAAALGALRWCFTYNWR
ncbi:hypothetical protein [Microbacterium sp. Root166]|uniref:hypothetical protein n=1 Tax=Microbacterium sp. Root166 TaxID=1736478 RepID=UPI0012FBBC52|nr:hypothetical protein [Microbacterium sp. Root166]